MDAQTIEEYMDLEKKIASAETLRYILITSFTKPIFKLSHKFFK